MYMCTVASHTPSHTHTLTQAAINQSYMNDDALEELSLAREPRHRDSSAMNTLKSVPELPKFSEWASGRSSSLDTHNIKKNVKQMVDVSVYVFVRERESVCVRERERERECVCVFVMVLLQYQLFQAVFRAYDTDDSGTISMGEFEAISSNFPFIEHFSVLDQDK